MKIEPADQHLNLFRFYGDTSHWEDNVTRGLLVLLTRAAAGGLILRELLDRCVELRCAKGYRTEDGDELRELAAQLATVQVRGQTYFSANEDEQADSGLAVLIALSPASKPPESYGNERPATVTSQEDQLTGRFDAQLDCITGDGHSFQVVVESKLYSQVGDEQWNRYVAKLSAQGRRCVQVQLSWADVTEILEGLPTANRADPLVADYLEYLTDMYWLSGFRGFRHHDFTPNGRDSRRWRLRQLAAAVAERDEEIVGWREVRGGFDIDLYVRGQYQVLGNTGLAAWEDKEAGVKLVIGAFSPPDGEVSQRLQKESGLSAPDYPTYWGTRRLLQLDQSEVATCIERTAQSIGLQAQVMFRLWFHRFKDVYIFSRTWDLKSVDWPEVARALRAGEPPTTRYVDQKSLDQLEQFLEDPNQLKEPRHDLSTADRSPTHHALLLLWSPMSPDELVSAGADNVVDLARQRHRQVLQLLRDLSRLRPIENVQPS